MCFTFLGAEGETVEVTALRPLNATEEWTELVERVTFGGSEEVLSFGR